MTPDTDKREWLGEWIYAKFVQNYEKLLKENKSLKENLELVRRHRDGLEEENKKLKEKLQWWKDLVQKAKEFEYDEDGMDYIWQNTKI